jgi:hypothetical protein
MEVEKAEDVEQIEKVKEWSGNGSFEFRIGNAEDRSPGCPPADEFTQVSNQSLRAMTVFPGLLRRHGHEHARTSITM